MEWNPVTETLHRTVHRDLECLVWREPDSWAWAVIRVTNPNPESNVVLGTAFGIASGVVVDTHVFRIVRRLKLTKQNTPEKVEQDLMKLVPQDRWFSFSHQVIWFGRKVCYARKPLCAECPIESICDAPDKTT